MADRVSPAALKASLGTLRGYLDDLAGSSFQQHGTKLRLFVNYFQKDDTVRYLADRLHTRLTDVLQAALKPDPVLPDDPADRIAFVYGVLYHLKQGHKLEVRELLSRAFAGSSIETKWDLFRKRWLSVLAEGLGALARDVEAKLGDDPVDPAELFAQALGARSPAPPPAAKPLSTPSPPPAAALPAAAAGGEREGGSRAGATRALHDAVARLPEAHRADLALEVEILALERTKRRKDVRRLAEIYAGFDAVSRELGGLARAFVSGG